MSLKAQIQEEMKVAMRSQDRQKLATLRLLLAEIKQKEVDQRIVLDDVAVLAVIEKMIKQRQDSIRQFEVAKRIDLVEIEKAEIDVLSVYRPKQLSNSEIEAEVRVLIESMPEASMKEMGKVMAALKEKLAGKADMAEVSKQVKTILASR